MGSLCQSTCKHSQEESKIFLYSCEGGLITYSMRKKDEEEKKEEIEYLASYDLGSGSMLGLDKFIVSKIGGDLEVHSLSKEQFEMLYREWFRP